MKYFGRSFLAFIFGIAFLANSAQADEVFEEPARVTGEIKKVLVQEGKLFFEISSDISALSVTAGEAGCDPETNLFQVDFGDSVRRGAVMTAKVARFEVSFLVSGCGINEPPHFHFDGFELREQLVEAD